MLLNILLGLVMMFIGAWVFIRNNKKSQTGHSENKGGHLIEKKGASIFSSAPCMYWRLFGYRKYNQVYKWL